MDNPANLARPRINGAVSTEPSTPLVQDEIVRQDATAMLRWLRQGQISSVELVEAHIRRIEQVNPRLNALVTDTFDEAVRTAHAADILIHKGGPLPALLGLPYTIKDAFPVAGVRFTAGSLRLKHNIAGEDAEIVRRMKAAGAILLGKTNVPDMSSSVDTDNLIFGRTGNPWDPRRSAGGSSGGEAALIATGGSPLGWGSDFAGSVRIPAASCGVPGLKCSPGRIPLTGHVPTTPSEMADWNTAGPLARRVGDLNLALGVLSGGPTIALDSIPLKGRKLIVPEPLKGYLPSRENEAALEAALLVLRDRGMSVQRGGLRLDRLPYEYAGRLYRYWLPSLRRQLSGGRQYPILIELLNHALGRPTISRKVLALLAMMAVTGPFLVAAGRGRTETLAALRASVLDAIGEEGVILWYWSTSGAPPTAASGLTGSSGYTIVFNALGFPAAVVPTGMGRDGLPLAVQVAAGPGHDEVALAACQAIEGALGGWRPIPF